MNLHPSFEVICAGVFGPAGRPVHSGLHLNCESDAQVFSGLRGGLFTLAITSLNIRVRMALFRSLLSQEVGFYDTNKLGRS